MSLKLVRFLMRLTGETVVVELKNGSVVQGTVVGQPHTHSRAHELTQPTQRAPHAQPRLSLLLSSLSPVSCWLCGSQAWM